MIDSGLCICGRSNLLSTEDLFFLSLVTEAQFLAEHLSLGRKTRLATWSSCGHVNRFWPMR